MRFQNREFQKGKTFKLLLSHVLETNNCNPLNKLFSFVRHVEEIFLAKVTVVFFLNEDFQQVLASLVDKTKVIVRERPRRNNFNPVVQTFVGQEGNFDLGL